MLDSLEEKVRSWVCYRSPRQQQKWPRWSWRGMVHHKHCPDHKNKCTCGWHNRFHTFSELEVCLKGGYYHHFSKHQHTCHYHHHKKPKFCLMTPWVIVTLKMGPWNANILSWAMSLMIKNPLKKTPLLIWIPNIPRNVIGTVRNEVMGFPLFRIIFILLCILIRRYTLCYLVIMKEVKGTRNTTTWRFLMTTYLWIADLWSCLCSIQTY